MTRVPACVLVLAAAFMLAGCGNDDDDDDASGGETVSAVQSADCLPADTSIMAPLGNSLKNGARARSGYLVRSGDLYYLSVELDGSGLGHVGLYIGRGRMVHAPQSGRTVEVVALRGSYYGRLAGARRIRG